MHTLLIALMLFALTVIAMKIAGCTPVSVLLLLWLALARPPRDLKPPSIA